MHDDEPRTTTRDEEPRVLSRAREPEAIEPRLSTFASIVILASLVVFVVAGLSIPSSTNGLDDGGRPIAAAIVAVGAFVTAVVTFALGALRRPRR